MVYIEDDAKLARLTARYLESHALRVIVAGNARDGIATVMRERPDVILLDLMLPGTDGAGHRGLGLGLVLVRRIVEAPWGTANLDSTVGKGTTATVHLPLASHD